MNSAQGLDARSSLVVDTHDLGRGPGLEMHLHRVAEAPADLGIGVIGVVEESPVELDLRLESAGDGVFVSGTATVTLTGECVRCLAELSDTSVADIQELYFYPGNVPEDDEPDEVSQLVGELLDLEPALRDAVVLELPFQPLCRPDCQGLCSQCGTDLNTAPDHEHPEPIDPRWAALSDWLTSQPDQSQN